MNPHDMSTDKDLKDIITTCSDLDAIPIMNNDTTGLQQTQWNLLTALEIVNHRLENDTYDKYYEGAPDFKDLFFLFQGLNNSQANPANSSFLADSLSLEIEKIFAKTLLTGRTEFQLDIELSIYDLIAQKKNNAEQYADSLNTAMRNDLDSVTVEAKTTSKELLAKSNDRKKEFDTNQTRGREALEAAITANKKQTKDFTYESLDSINVSVKRRFDSIPSIADTLFHTTLPKELPGCNNGKCGSCGTFNLKCKIIKKIKEEINKAYKKKYKEARGKLNTKAKNLRDTLKVRANAKTQVMKDTVDIKLNRYETKAKRLIADSSKELDTVSIAAFSEINKGIHEADRLVVTQLGVVGDFVGTLNAQTLTIIEETAQVAEKINRETMRDIDRVIYLSILWSDILLALLVISSFLYVFTRFAFSEDYDLYVGIRGDDTKPYENGTLTHHGTEYQIQLGNTIPMFFSRKYLPTGRAPKVALPQWTSGIVGRIRAGVYLMNEVEVRENEVETVDFRSLAGAEFVEWNLSEGEEIVFNYNDLVAMSETVELSTHISFRVSSMIFGTPVFRIAKGPGKIVLITKGKPITNQDEHLVKSSPIERIIAWQSSTRFSVNSELNIADLYLSGLYLKRTNEDLIIIDADAGKARRKTGMVRFVPSFLLPK